MIVQMWDGMGLQVTEDMVPLFPPCSYEDFPAKYCGAGNGLGEKLVPDYIFGYTRILPVKLDISIKISPACRIHDLDWQLAPASWDAFFAANSRLYANIKAIVEKRATGYPAVLRWRALQYPAIYAAAVNTIGRPIFWGLKKDEGYQVPASAGWILHEAIA